MNVYAGHWEFIDEIFVGDSTASMEINYTAIKCADSLHCIAAGKVGLIRAINRVTTDGGNTWFTNVIDTGYNGDDSRLYDVYFKDTSLAIMTSENNQNWISTDAGRSWQRVKYNGDYHRNVIGRFKIAMFDDKNGFIASSNTVYSTTDSGLTWSKVFLGLPDSLTTVGFEDIQTVGDSTIYIIAHTRKIFYLLIKSTNRGLTWQPLSQIMFYLSFSFIDSSNGWAAGMFKVNTNTYNSRIIHTTDSGRNWVTQLDSLPVNFPGGLKKIYFKDKNDGIAFGPYQNIWRTTNGGKYWWQDTSFRNTKDYVYPTDMAFFSHEKIIAVTSNEKIYKYVGSPLSVGDNPSAMFEEIDFNLYPNPVKQGSSLNIEIQLSVSLQGQFKIYNSLGQLIDVSETYVLKIGKNIIKYEPSGNLMPGIYLYQLIYNSRVLNKKFIIY